MMVTLSSAQPFNPNKAGFFKDSFFLGQERGDFKRVYIIHRQLICHDAKDKECKILYGHDYIMSLSNQGTFKILPNKTTRPSLQRSIFLPLISSHVFSSTGTKLFY